MKSDSIRISDFEINTQSDVFIIAEMSANHNGSLDYAINTIKSAKRAGADCIKLQTYKPDTITLDCDSKDFIIKGTIWNGRKLHDLYREAYTPWDWHEKLFKVAKDEGLVCFSSPFDNSAVDLLENLNSPAYKIASFEITDINLIEYVAKKGKPIIISTGIATENDIDLAIETCIKAGNNQIILLKCTSSYPAPIDEANLTMIKHLREKYGYFTGLSDHTEGYVAPIVATSLGAKVIEKHFIIDKSIGGPDSSFSLDENEFKLMVDNVRKASKSVGIKTFDLTKKQHKGRNFSRSLYFVNNLKKDQIISVKDIKSIRPGFGLHPKFLNKIIGKRINLDVSRGTRVSLEQINLDE